MKRDALLEVTAVRADDPFSLCATNTDRVWRAGAAQSVCVVESECVSLDFHYMSTSCWLGYSTILTTLGVYPLAATSTGRRRLAKRTEDCRDLELS